MATLTAEQVYALARKAGANPQEATILTAIARSESSWNSAAHYQPGTGEDSYGLWQINMDPSYAAGRRKTFGIASNNALFDPLTNAKAALSVLRSQGYKAWSVYTTNDPKRSYRQHLPAAKAAATAVGEDYGDIDVATGGSVPTNDVLPEGASPEQIEQHIRDNYPEYAGFLDVPEIRAVLIEAARDDATDQEWSFEKLTSRVRNTQWYKANGEASRNYFALKELDPASAKRTLDQKIAEIRNDFVQSGAPGDLAQWAETALKYGWTAEELRTEWGKHLGTQSASTGLKDGSTVDLTADSIRRMARNDYLVPLGQQDAEKWAIEIYTGRMTEDQVRAILERQAAARFPGLVEQGITPGAYLAPIRSAIAEQLELNEADIDLLDRRYSDVLETQTDKGIRPMTISEAQRWARSQDAYQHTKGARDNASALVETLTSTFGVV